MNKYLLVLRQWLNTRTEKDRLYLLVGCCIVIGLIWWSLFFSVQQDARNVLSGKIKSLELQVDGADKLVQAANDKINQGPDPKLLAQMQSLEQQLQTINANLGIANAGAAVEQQAIDGIKALIENNKGLKLINLSSVSEAMKVQTADEKSNAANSTDQTTQLPTTPDLALMKHDITLELQGNYFAVSTYLKDLEQLKIHFFFHDLNYTVTQYPNAKVIMKVHIIN